MWFVCVVTVVSILLICSCGFYWKTFEASPLEWGSLMKSAGVVLVVDGAGRKGPPPLSDTLHCTYGTCLPMDALPQTMHSGCIGPEFVEIEVASLNCECQVKMSLPISKCQTFQKSSSNASLESHSLRHALLCQRFLIESPVWSIPRVLSTQYHSGHPF